MPLILELLIKRFHWRSNRFSRSSIEKRQWLTISNLDCNFRQRWKRKPWKPNVPVSVMIDTTKRNTTSKTVSFLFIKALPVKKMLISFIRYCFMQIGLDTFKLISVWLGKILSLTVFYYLETKIFIHLVLSEDKLTCNCTTRI